MTGSGRLAFSQAPLLVRTSRSHSSGGCDQKRARTVVAKRPVKGPLTTAAAVCGACEAANYRCAMEEWTSWLLVAIATLAKVPLTAQSQPAGDSTAFLRLRRRGLSNFHQSGPSLSTAASCLMSLSRNSMNLLGKSSATLAVSCQSF